MDPDPDCNLHWTSETSTEEWREFGQCAKDIFDECGALGIDVEVHNDGAGRHMDLHVHKPDDC